MIAPFPWDKIGIIVGAGAFAVVLLCLVSRLIDRGEHSAPRTRWRDAFGDLPVALRDLADDDGRDIADLFADDYPDDPGPVAGDEKPSGIAGPGYFHDDAPTTAIPSVRVQGVYLPNLGHPDLPRPGLPREGSMASPQALAGPGQPDDTVIDLTPYPRGGAAAWQAARPNPRVPARDSRPEWIWCGGTWTRLGAAGVPWLDTLFTAPLRMLEAAA